MNNKSKLIWSAAVAGGFVAILLMAAAKPGLFSNPKYLGGILLIEILAVCAWQYVRAFFPLLLVAFLLAGMRFPFRSEAQMIRWGVLGLAACIGFVLWLRERRQHHFGYFHFVALTCVCMALVSAAVSGAPWVAAQKVFSLFLLFLYAACGARLVFQGREQEFLSQLVLGSEIMTYFSALCYLILRIPVFGNPNALGAIMGVVVVPVLFWDVLVNPKNNTLRYRRMFLLLVATWLLYDSLSRASILAAAVSTVGICLALRRRTFLLRTSFVVVLLITAAGVLNPSKFDNFVSALTANILYKGKQTSDVFASREAPWREAKLSIQRHPWFGSGFGTSDAMQDAPNVVSARTVHGTTREHGNSYLALAEYTGLLGVIPFGVLIFLVLRRLAQVYLWMVRSAPANNYYIPLAMIVTGGLVHAFFEDWLFAAGFYLCVFFWSITFPLMDFVPMTVPRSLRNFNWQSPVQANIGMQAAARTSGTGLPLGRRI